MKTLTVRAAGLVAGLTDNFWVMGDLVGKSSTSSLYEELRQILEGKSIFDEFVSFVESIADTIDTLLNPAELAFQLMVATNVVDSVPISIPSAWEQELDDYADTNKADGDVLQSGLLRGPAFHRGGWICGLRPSACAITLDRDVFVPTGGKLSLDFYIHEMVHVFQYGLPGGPIGFLTSYFMGIGIGTVFAEIQGGKFNEMKDNVQEQQAYRIQDRFKDWYRIKYDGAEAWGEII